MKRNEQDDDEEQGEEEQNLDCEIDDEINQYTNDHHTLLFFVLS